MRLPKFGTITRNHSYFAEIRSAPEPEIHTLDNFEHCLYSGEDLFSELRTIYDRVRETIEIRYSASQAPSPEDMVPVKLNFYRHINPLRKMMWHSAIMKKIENPLIVLEPGESDGLEASIVLATGSLMRAYGISPKEQAIVAPAISVSANFLL